MKNFFINFLKKFQKKNIIMLFSSFILAITISISDVSAAGTELFCNNDNDILFDRFSLTCLNVKNIINNTKNNGIDISSSTYFKIQPTKSVSYFGIGLDDDTSRYISSGYYYKKTTDTSQDYLDTFGFTSENQVAINSTTDIGWADNWYYINITSDYFNDADKKVILEIEGISESEIENEWLYIVDKNKRFTFEDKEIYHASSRQYVIHSKDYEEIGLENYLKSIHIEYCRNRDINLSYEDCITSFQVDEKSNSLTYVFSNSNLTSQIDFDKIEYDVNNEIVIKLLPNIIPKFNYKLEYNRDNERLYIHFDFGKWEQSHIKALYNDDGTIQQYVIQSGTESSKYTVSSSSKIELNFHYILGELVEINKFNIDVEELLNSDEYRELKVEILASGGISNDGNLILSDWTGIFDFLSSVLKNAYSIVSMILTIIITFFDGANSLVIITLLYAMVIDLITKIIDRLRRK